VRRELCCVNDFLGVAPVLEKATVAVGSRNAPFISLFALPMLEPVVISHA
jgi:hypothetical protein